MNLPKTRLLTLSLLFPVSVLVSPAYADNQLKLKAAESKKVVMEFAGQLKGELKSAMKTGGPITAITVCKDKAPAIAQALSEKYGWRVARTSLKTRNPDNAPDSWERDVLEKFEERKRSGEAVQPMAFFEEVSENGQASFRFMKAIPTGKVCLSCHGQAIKPEVIAKLNKDYPQDKARGFKLGDIRGAFTITQPAQ